MTTWLCCLELNGSTAIMTGVHGGGDCHLMAVWEPKRGKEGPGPNIPLKVISHGLGR